MCLLLILLCMKHLYNGIGGVCGGGVHCVQKVVCTLYLLERLPENFSSPWKWIQLVSYCQERNKNAFPFLNFKRSNSHS